MGTVFAALGVAILAVAVCWWILAVVVFPVKELIAVLRRIAAGDFRPVILSGVPILYRRAGDDLRRTVETLAQQKALLEEEEFSLSVILKSMAEGVVITGADLRIRQVNTAAAKMFNLKGSVAGLLLTEVFLSHELQGVARRAAESGQVQRGELAMVIPGRNDRGHLAVTAAALKGPGKADADGILLVFHDVSRLRELESVRREFVANVSHEFRTPLSIITGYLETLGDEDLGKEMRSKSIAVMQRHAERLNRLIDDLLTISRMEEKAVRLETRCVELEPLLRGVVEQAEQERLQRGVEVRIEVATGLPAINVDAFRIEQAFTNLLVNALRHGTPADAKGGVVTIGMELSGSEVAVSFRDQGPGIPLADQEHLFERFYRVGGDRARQTGGTGLGLSIVKNVAQAHGGRVALQSTPGEGSTFTIFFPLDS